MIILAMSIIMLLPLAVLIIVIKVWPEKKCCGNCSNSTIGKNCVINLKCNRGYNILHINTKKCKYYLRSETCS